MAHYLARAYGQCIYIQFANIGRQDKDNYEEVLDRYVHNYKCVVLDQVNSMLLPEAIVHRRSGEKNKLPFVMYTSGHFLPDEVWYEGSMIKNFIFCKAFDMLLSNKDVKNFILKKTPVFKSLAEKDLDTFANRLCSVTRRYYLLVTCIMHVSKDATAEQIQEKCFNIPLDKKIEGFKEEILVGLWPELLKLNMKEMSDNEFMKILEGDKKLLQLHKGQLLFLGRKFAEGEFPPGSGSGIRDVLNWLTLVKEDDSEYDKGGYVEKEVQDLAFTFVNRKHIIDVLLHQVKKKFPTLDSMLDALDNMYQMVGVLHDPGLHLVKEKCFETYIHLLVKKSYDPDTKRYRGFMYRLGSNDKPLMVTTYVDQHAEVSTVEDLVSLVKNPLLDVNKDTGTYIVEMFVSLNIPGAPQFPGFDYAYIQVMHMKEESNHRVEIVQLQLHHVTVSLTSKQNSLTKSVMARQLTTITLEMKKQGLLAALSYPEMVEEAKKILIPILELAGDSNTMVLDDYTVKDKKTDSIWEFKIAQTIGIPRCTAVGAQ